MRRPPDHEPARSDGREAKGIDLALSRYLSAPEAADYLRVSLSWLRKATSDGRLPHIKLGHRVIFDREDLDEFMQRRKVETAWRGREDRRGRGPGVRALPRPGSTSP